MEISEYAINCLVSGTISYIVNQFPKYKNLPIVNEFFKERKLNKLLNSSYEDAVDNICPNTTIANSIKGRFERNLKALGNNLKEAELKNEDTKLFCEWVNLLKNDPLTFLYYIDLKNDKHYKETEISFNEIKDSLKHIENKIGSLGWKNLKGVKKHEKIEDYFQRYCSDEITNRKNSQLTLSDFIIGNIKPSKNKFILSGNAQFGKTTELKNLCWNLQESNLYLPILFETRDYCNLKCEDLPTSRFYNDKEIIVVIDALDEVNGTRFNDLISEIRTYCKENPEIKVVLSCRGNYKCVDNTLDMFQELYLTDIGQKEIFKYLERKNCNTESFESIVRDHNLYEFLKTPFFLKIIVEEFINKGKIPNNRSEIYECFFNIAYEKEKKEKSHSTSSSSSNVFTKNDILEELQKLALAMSLLDVQYITEEAILKVHNDNTNLLQACLRLDIVMKKDDRFFFPHTAIREWLVAKLLMKKDLDFIKRVATIQDIDEIKPNWQNILVLLVSMFHKENTYTHSLIEWLKSSAPELITFTDPNLLTPATRVSIMKDIILKYKTLGCRLGSLMDDTYTRLINYDSSIDFFKFIVNEFKNTDVKNNYWKDLSCLCQLFDLNYYYFENDELVKDYIEVIKKKTIELIDAEDIEETDLLYLENKYIADNYFDSLFEIMSVSNNYVIIKSLIEIISQSKRVDKYVDYILEKEKFVHNQHNEFLYTIHVPRHEIYNCLKHTESISTIIKVLRHDFITIRGCSDFDYNNYHELITFFLQKLYSYTDKDILQDTIYELGKNIRRIKGYEIIHCDMFEIITFFCVKMGISDSFKTKFWEQFEWTENITHEKYKELGLLLCFWLTKEDIDSIYDKYSKKTGFENLVNLLTSDENQNVSNYAIQMYLTNFPENDPQVARERDFKASINLLTDFEKFKEKILLFVNSNKNIVDALFDYREEFYISKDTKDIIFVKRYINSFDTNDNQIKETIIHSLENTNRYDAFIVNEVGELLLKRDNVPESLKTKCLEIGISMVEGNHHFFTPTALKLLMANFYKTTDDNLLKYLNLSELELTIIDTNSRIESLSYFEYIKRNCAKEKLTTKVLQMANLSPNRIPVCFINFFIDYNISEGLSLMLNSFNKDDNNLNYALHMLSADIKIKEIKAISKKKSFKEKVELYSLLLSKHPEERNWVKEQLETYNPNYISKQALSLLLHIGSLNGLNHLVENKDFYDVGIFDYEYDDALAINNLCTIIKSISSEGCREYLCLESIINSLEVISLQSEENLIQVVNSLENVINNYSNLGFLHLASKRIQRNYYLSKTPEQNINSIMEFLTN